MSENSAGNSQPTNRILAALPFKEYQRLLPQMESFNIEFAQILYEPDQSIHDVYFPNSGIISLLSGIDAHATLEVGMVGREGMVGLPVFLGVFKSQNQAIVQGKGRFMKMRSADLLEECKLGGALPHLLQRYTHSLLTQISRSATCNQFHQIGARLARWLLMMFDRIERNEFQLTHEFLSNMLGVRREAVTKAAHILQQQHLIRYSRGNIKILDLPGLKAAACRCFALIKQEEDSFPG